MLEGYTSIPERARFVEVCALAFAFALAAPASAAERFWYARDGDTPVLQTGEVIRLRSILGPIDAPEMHKVKCPLELFRAKAAKERLSAIMRAAANDFSIDRKGLDRYGRTVGVLYAVGEDVGALLVREGHAKPWQGLRRETRPKWC